MQAVDDRARALDAERGVVVQGELGQARVLRDERANQDARERIEALAGDAEHARWQSAAISTQLAHNSIAIRRNQGPLP